MSSDGVTRSPSYISWTGAKKAFIIDRIVRISDSANLWDYVMGYNSVDMRF